MVTAIPATGTAIKMGGVYAAYTSPGTYPSGGTNVTLNAMLGVAKSGLRTAGQITPLSATFGGRVGHFSYF
jgi:hypothetical protein